MAYGQNGPHMSLAVESGVLGVRATALQAEAEEAQERQPLADPILDLVRPLFRTHGDRGLTRTGCKLARRLAAGEEVRR